MPRTVLTSPELRTNSHTFTIPNYKPDTVIRSIVVTPADAKFTTKVQGTDLIVTVTGGTRYRTDDNAGMEYTWEYADQYGGSCPSSMYGLSYTGWETGNSGRTMCNYSGWREATDWWNVYRYTVNVQTYTPTLPGTISHQVPGTYVNFDGEDFIILNPQTGYLLKAEPLSAKRPFSSVTNLSYDPQDNRSVAHFLNNDYFNRFSKEAREVIQNKAWGIGLLTQAQAGFSTNKPSVTLEAMRNLENSVTVNAPIGILSASEWRTYSQNANNAGANGFLPSPSANTLLISTMNGTTSLVVGTNGLITSIIKVTNSDVIPSLYVDPNLKVVEGNVIFNNKPVVTLRKSTSAVYEGGTLQIKGDVSDLDTESLTLKFRVDNGAEHTILSETSDGISLIPFTLNLLYNGGELKFGEKVILKEMNDGASHTLSIYAIDINNGLSSMIEIPFKMYRSISPEITFVENKGDNGDILCFQLSDEDSILSSVEVIVNGVVEREITSDFLEPIEYKLNTRLLTVGDANTVQVIATNNIGDTFSIDFKLSYYLPLTPFIPDVENFSMDGALSIVGKEEAENFVEMVNKVVGINLTTAEVQLIGSNTRNEKTSQRFTFRRSSANIDYNINLYTGAID